VTEGTETKLALLEHRIEQAEKKQDTFASAERVKAIEEREKEYVTTEQLYPIKSLVYGGTGLILTSVLMALIALVVKGAS